MDEPCPSNVWLQAITRGHKRHLEGCKATRKKTEEKRETAENEDEDEEVQEEKPQKRRASNAKVWGLYLQQVT